MSKGGLIGEQRSKSTFRMNKQTLLNIQSVQQSMSCIGKTPTRNRSVQGATLIVKPKLNTPAEEDDKLSITFDIGRPLSTLNVDHTPISTREGGPNGSSFKNTMGGSGFRHTSALGFKSAQQFFDDRSHSQRKWKKKNFDSIKT